jgi:hypothetical protein
MFDAMDSYCWVRSMLTFGVFWRGDSGTLNSGDASALFVKIDELEFGLDFSRSKVLYLKKNKYFIGFNESNNI